MKRTKKSKNVSQNKKEAKETFDSTSITKDAKDVGKPGNFSNHGSGQSVVPEIKSEEESKTPDTQPEMDHKTIIAKEAMERETQYQSRQDLLLGEKALPGVLQILARVYDFEKGCMLEKPKEKAVEPPLPESEPVATPPPPPPPQQPKLPEVPIVPPERLPTNVDKLQRRPAYITFSEYQRRQQESKLSGNMTRFNSVASNARHASVPFQRPLSQANPSVNNGVWHKPIIVVPSEVLSVVSMHNVQLLLEQFQFIPPNEMRNLNPRRLDDVIINRTHNGKQLQYRAIDNIKALKNEDWAQIVAVFVLNPKTQFIGWPLNGNPAAICRRVCAFHLTFRGHRICPEIEALNLTILCLPEIGHNVNLQIIRDFWQKVDQHMERNPF